MTCLLTIALGALVFAASHSPSNHTTHARGAARFRTGWRQPDPEKLFYLDVKGGRVVIEPSSEFAPKHVANIQEILRRNYWKNAVIFRSQDNYVVQWGDPQQEKDGVTTVAAVKKLEGIPLRLPPEFERSIDKDLSFTPLKNQDAYAPEVGFSNGFPAGRDQKTKKTWMLHCYGVVGVSRGMEVDSGMAPAYMW